MRSVELILAVILAVIVVLDVKLPLQISQFVGSGPGLVVVLGIVLYLFSKSNSLGVLGILAGFIAVRHTSPSLPVFAPSPTVDGLSFNSQFPITLEETIIKNLVPMVRTAGRGAISNSFGNTHDAADAY